MIDEEQIIKNFETFRKILSNVGSERVENVMQLVDHLSDRLATSPASSREDRHNAFTGGLVDHSLRVLKFARILTKSLGLDIPVKSLILCCLFHDLGKVGDDKEPYYLPQDSEWRRNNLKEMYTYNPRVKFTTTDRTLWLLQYFGVKLNSDEWLALRLADGQYVDENKAYKMKESTLATIVHQADLLATKFEKGDLAITQEMSETYLR